MATDIQVERMVAEHLASADGFCLGTLWTRAPLSFLVRYYRGVRGCSRLWKIWSCIFGRFSSKNYYGKPYSNRNFGVFGCRIFKKRKVFGEKIEKIKIASKHFKDCPWATQSPNMSFQLPLGSKIIAAEIWSRKSGNLSRISVIFSGDPIVSGSEPSTPPKNPDFKFPQL